MHLDDLKNIWDGEVSIKKSIPEFNELRRQVDKYDRRARVGWALELLVCIGLIIAIIARWVARSSAEELNLPIQAGMSAVILILMLVAFKIVKTHKASVVDDWSLYAKINIQIEKREKDARMLSTTAYWYLTPLFVVVILGSYGGYTQRTGSLIPDMGMWIYWLAALVLYAGIYFLQQRYVNTKLRPLINQLYTLKRELES